VTLARRFAWLPALAVSLLLATPAHAHTNASLGDFYQGLLQPFFHPEFLLGALAIALWSTQQPPRARLATCGGFAAGVLIGAAAALLGVAGEGTVWGPRLCMLVVGPMVAASLQLPLSACAGLAVLAGLAQGHAATAGEIAQIVYPVLWTLGLGLGALLLGAYANAATERFRAFWMQVGVRIAGSWIAAIGLLASVMAARGR
jgi:hydrogenase/urease accessory protein HupE